MKISRVGIVVVSLLIAACQSTAPPSRPRLENEGALYLYLQPLAEDARRARLTIEAISAVHVDGRETPLAVSLREISADTARRQRLLAAGPLPAGDYSGLVVRLATPRGQGQQPPPDAPAREAGTRVDFKFTVRRAEGQVVAIILTSAGAAFHVYSPTRPGVGVMGFVANTGSSDVTVFDKKTMQVFDVIVTGHAPSGMALDQRARKLYVALSGDDGVAVIDVLSGKVTDRIRLSPGDEPVEVALTPDGTVLLSANKGSNTVSIVDAVSRFEVAKVPVGNSPASITVDRTGRRAFVFGPLTNGVTVIDILGRSVFRTIVTDPGPVRGQFNRRGDRLYVVHETSPYVTVINPSTLTVTSRFPVRFPMDTLKVDPGTDYVYLGGRRSFAVSLYDPLSFAVIDTVQDSGGTVNMTADVEDNTLYLVNQSTNRVLVFERIRKRRVGELDVGDGPTWISVMGES